jgi:hypothetical protein
MRSMMELGSVFRSAAPTEPRVPEGDMRRPFSSTNERVGPKPRRPTVLAPGPPSVT